MQECYANVTFPNYAPVLVSWDDQITNDVNYGDSSISFRVNTDIFEPGETVWVGGYVDMDGGSLVAFSQRADALTYAVSFWQKTKLSEEDVESILQTDSILMDPNEPPYYTDLLVIKMTLPQE